MPGGRSAPECFSIAPLGAHATLRTNAPVVRWTGAHTKPQYRSSRRPSPVTHAQTLRPSCVRTCVSVCVCLICANIRWPVGVRMCMYMFCEALHMHACAALSAQCVRTRTRRVNKMPCPCSPQHGEHATRRLRRKLRINTHMNTSSNSSSIHAASRRYRTTRTTTTTMSLRTCECYIRHSVNFL